MCLPYTNTLSQTSLYLKRSSLVLNVFFNVTFRKISTFIIIITKRGLFSPLCLVWVQAPLWPHVRQAKFCLRVCQVVFLGVLPFSPHLLIGPSHMSCNNLERDVKLNLRKKKEKKSGLYNKWITLFSNHH